MSQPNGIVCGCVSKILPNTPNIFLSQVFRQRHHLFISSSCLRNRLDIYSPIPLKLFKSYLDIKSPFRFLALRLILPSSIPVPSSLPNSPCFSNSPSVQKPLSSTCSLSPAAPPRRPLLLSPPLSLSHFDRDFIRPCPPCIPPPPPGLSLTPPLPPQIDG